MIKIHQTWSSFNVHVCPEGLVVWCFINNVAGHLIEAAGRGLCLTCSSLGCVPFQVGGGEHPGWYWRSRKKFWMVIFLFGGHWDIRSGGEQFLWDILSCLSLWDFSCLTIRDVFFFWGRGLKSIPTKRRLALKKIGHPLATISWKSLPSGSITHELQGMKTTFANWTSRFQLLRIHVFFFLPRFRRQPFIEIRSDPCSKKKSVKKKNMWPMACGGKGRASLFFGRIVEWISMDIWIFDGRSLS